MQLTQLSKPKYELIVYKYVRAYRTIYMGRSQGAVTTNLECPLRHDMMRGGRIYESVESGMLEIAERHFPTSVARQSRYDARHLNNVMLLGGVFNVNVSGCMKSVRFTRKWMKKYREMTDRIEMPCGEWKRLVLEKLPAGASMSAFEDEVQRALQMIRELGTAPDKWDLAIDMHMIPRYDKKHGPELVRSKSKSGTDLFERYITVHSLMPGARIAPAVLPMPALGEKAAFVGALVERCRGLGLDIGTVMPDREFFSVDVIRTLDGLGVRYLIPCRNTFGVIETIGEFAGKRRGRVSEMDLKGGGGKKARYISVITTRKKRRRRNGGGYVDEDVDVFDYDPEEPPHRQYIAFATNDPGIDVEEYSRRWGIETAYRQIEAARPRTRSCNPEVRTFHFLYAAMLFNVWVVINAAYAVQDGRPAASRDGAPKVTQTDMKICILFFVLLSTPRKKPPPEMPRTRIKRAPASCV